MRIHLLKVSLSLLLPYSSASPAAASARGKFNLRTSFFRSFLPLPPQTQRVLTHACGLIWVCWRCSTQMETPRFLFGHYGCFFVLPPSHHNSTQRTRVCVCDGDISSPSPTKASASARKHSPIHVATWLGFSLLSSWPVGLRGGPLSCCFYQSHVCV